MSFLETTSSLLARIDYNYQELQGLVGKYKHALPEIDTWSSHFACTWTELLLQLGWPTRKPKSGVLLEKLRHALRIGRGGQAPPISFHSPIFNEDVDLGMPFHPSYSTIPTEYGFKLCATGRDMWHPLASGHYLTELSESFITMALAKSTDSFIDVGANIGFFSFLFVKEASEPNIVIACEPSRENISLILAGVETNGFNDKIRVIQKAVGESEGTVTLYLNGLGSGGNTIMQVHDDSYRRVMGETAAYFPRSESVPVTTLDAIYDSHMGGRKACLVKIDVEGYEKGVLAGATRWLSDANAPIILYEAWPDSSLSPKGENDRETAGILEEFSYKVWRIEHAKHGEALLSDCRSGNRFRRSRTGNYLGVPRQRQGVEKQFLSSLDIRIFTGVTRLRSLCDFTESCLRSLRQRVNQE